MDNNPFNQENYQQTVQFQAYMQWLRENPSVAPAAQQLTPQNVHPQQPTPENVYSQQFTPQNFQVFELGDDSVHYQYEQHANTPYQGSNSMSAPNDDDDDEEEEEGREPAFQPQVNITTSQGPSRGRSTGKRNWSHREEVVLVSSYMEHCTDSLCGTNQKGSDLWKKVFLEYEKARVEKPHELPERTVGMMENHWKRMCASIMKFVGCYDEADRIKKSGENKTDVKKRAHEIYNAEMKGKNFKYESIWEMLQEYHKWKPRVERFLPDSFRQRAKNSNSNSSGKRMREDGDPDLESSHNVGSGGCFTSGGSARPDGVKKAKAAAKRKGKGISSAVDDVAAMTLGENLRTHAEVRSYDINFRKEKLEFEKARQAENIKMQDLKMKNDLLAELLRKSSPLDEREQKLKDRLMAEMYGI